MNLDEFGKGVPEALLANITQSIIKQLFKAEKDLLKYFSLNNQLCENSPDFMFITLWIGVYNKPINILIYSNAGHYKPSINKNGVIKFLKMESEIVLGIMEDFKFKKEEIEISN